MNNLVVFAAHNTAAALLLALVVYGLTRIWRNPPVAHVLWLLVLIKFVAPPILRADWSTLRQQGMGQARGLLPVMHRLQKRLTLAPHREPETHG